MPPLVPHREPESAAHAKQRDSDGVFVRPRPPSHARRRMQAASASSSAVSGSGGASASGGGGEEEAEAAGDKRSLRLKGLPMSKSVSEDLVAKVCKQMRHLQGHFLVATLAELPADTPPLEQFDGEVSYKITDSRQVWPNR